MIRDLTSLDNLPSNPDELNHLVNRLYANPKGPWRRIFEIDENIFNALTGIRLPDEPFRFNPSRDGPIEYGGMTYGGLEVFGLTIPEVSTLESDGPIVCGWKRRGLGSCPRYYRENITDRPPYTKLVGRENTWVRWMWRPFADREMGFSIGLESAHSIDIAVRIRILSYQAGLVSRTSPLRWLIDQVSDLGDFEVGVQGVDYRSRPLVRFRTIELDESIPEVYGHSGPTTIEVVMLTNPDSVLIHDLEDEMVDVKECV